MLMHTNVLIQLNDEIIMTFTIEKCIKWVKNKSAMVARMGIWGSRGFIAKTMASFIFI